MKKPKNQKETEDGENTSQTRPGRDRYTNLLKFAARIAAEMSLYCSLTWFKGCQTATADFRIEAKARLVL